MKYILTLLVCLLFIWSLKAQDVIVKNDKTEIKSKVLEIDQDVIKYKKFDFQTGPIYSISKADVFMIIYQTGQKEYMSPSVVATPKSVPVNTPIQPSAKSKEDTIDNKIDNVIISLSLNDSFNSTDAEFNFKLFDRVYLGLSAYGGYSTPTSGGLYPFLAYKYGITKQRDFYLWGNAGYNYSYVGSYYIGSTYIPSTGAGGFLWEAGADYYFSKHFGITAYTSQGSSFWFGIVVRGPKLF